TLTSAVDWPIFCTDSYSDDSTTLPISMIFVSTGCATLRALQPPSASRSTMKRSTADARYSNDSGTPSSSWRTTYVWPPRMVLGSTSFPRTALTLAPDGAQAAQD